MTPLLSTLFFLIIIVVVGVKSKYANDARYWGKANNHSNARYKEYMAMWKDLHVEQENQQCLSSPPPFEGPLDGRRDLYVLARVQT